MFSEANMNELNILGLQYTESLIDKLKKTIKEENNLSSFS